MCTVLLPPGVNPIAVNKYISINTNKELSTITFSDWEWVSWLWAFVFFLWLFGREIGPTERLDDAERRHGAWFERAFPMCPWSKVALSLYSPDDPFKCDIRDWNTMWL